MSCNCKNIKPGSKESYTQMIEIAIPINIIIKQNNPEQERLQSIFIDPCLVSEIEYLWSLGIVTTGCCCGHNAAKPYVGVDAKYIPDMKKLGYKISENNTDRNRKDSFYPKLN